MVDSQRNKFGYTVAGGGFLIIMITMSLLINKTLELTWLVLALVVAGIFVVALGMYVVYPKETKEYLETAGNAADHIPVPRFGRNAAPDASGHPAAAVVTPAADQAVIVRPAASIPDGEEQEPELATAEGEQITRLVGNRNPYPHGDG